MEKHIPDLLELILKTPGLVKEESRLILFRMNQFRLKSPKIRVSNFGFRKSDIFPPETNASLLASKF